MNILKIINRFNSYKKIIVLNKSIFNEKQLASSMASYQSAKDEANRKQLYLERIVNPVISDKSTYPNRLFSIISYIVMLVLIWGISKFMLVAIREHSDT